jgi:hypothetical protein
VSTSAVKEFFPTPKEKLFFRAWLTRATKFPPHNGNRVPPEHGSGGTLVFTAPRARLPMTAILPHFVPLLVGRFPLFWGDRGAFAPGHAEKA